MPEIILRAQGKWREAQSCIIDPRDGMSSQNVKFDMSRLSSTLFHFCRRIEGDQLLPINRAVRSTKVFHKIAREPIHGLVPFSSKVRPVALGHILHEANEFEIEISVPSDLLPKSLPRKAAEAGIVGRFAALSTISLANERIKPFVQFVQAFSQSVEICTLPFVLICVTPA